MITTHIDSAALRYRLTAALVATGHLHSSEWIDAFRAVPREAFIDRFVAVDEQGQLTDHDLAGAERATALHAVYTDSSLLTQFDAGGTATSSSTTPSMMALMLEYLDAHPGHRVLEVGTGTGYNAALVCHALGSATVTTMDIHPQLVEQAADRLGKLGYTPRVEIGDGHDGAPQCGPYQRIIATCGFDRVPAAWRRQLTFDGIVVINVGFGLAVLHANSTGLSGPFVDQAALMAARTDTTDTAFTVRDALALVSTAWPGSRAWASVWPSYLHTTDASVAFLRSLLLPGVTYVEHRVEEGHQEVTLVDPISQSWTVTTATENGQAMVTEFGPRRLWHELLMLGTEWDDHGRPTPDRYGLTVQLDGTHMLWLDEPEQVVRVLPTAGSAY